MDNATGPVKAIAAVSILLWVAAIATGRSMACVV